MLRRIFDSSLPKPTFGKIRIYGNPDNVIRLKFLTRENPTSSSDVLGSMTSFVNCLIRNERRLKQVKYRNQQILLLSLRSLCIFRFFEFRPFSDNFQMIDYSILSIFAGITQQALKLLLYLQLRPTEKPKHVQKFILETSQSLLCTFYFQL